MQKSEMFKQLKVVVKIKFRHSSCDLKNAMIDAIDCLDRTDRELDEDLKAVWTKCPNKAKIIAQDKDWKQHPFNRLYVYRTAKRLMD